MQTPSLSINTISESTPPSTADFVTYWGQLLGVTTPLLVPPNTPIEKIECSFEFLESSYREQSLPKFIGTIAVFPTTNIFIRCFNEELQEMLNSWLNRDGILKECDDYIKFERAIDKMGLLQRSIDFLKLSDAPQR